MNALADFLLLFKGLFRCVASLEEYGSYSSQSGMLPFLAVHFQESQLCNLRMILVEMFTSFCLV